jgi:mannitol-1-phosphate/altronate dehydrogenase
MELSALSSLAGGSTVALLAIIIFWMYRQDKKEEAEKVRQEKDSEIARWQEQLRESETISKELIACREHDSQSREELAKNLGALAESIRSCGLK